MGSNSLVTGDAANYVRDDGQMILSSADAKVKTFMSQASASQKAIIQSINSDDPLMASFAQADARKAIILAADKEIKTYLASIADPRIGMVEVVDSTDGRPHDEAIADVMCIAVMNGFIPGKEQFSVFGKKNRSAALYVKKAGYELWFARLEDCSVPVVEHEHPHFRKFGTSDKNCWVVEGSAECVFRGNKYTVSRTGKQAIGIAGYPSDQIANVSTKVKRALLKSLWNLVSAYALDAEDDADDADAATVTVLPTTAIEGKAVDRTEPETNPETKQEDRQKTLLAFEQTRKDIEKRLSKDPSEASMFVELWNAITNADSLDALKSVGEQIKPAAKLFSGRDIEALRRWYEFRLTEHRRWQRS